MLRFNTFRLRLHGLPAALFCGGLTLTAAVCVLNNLQNRQLHEQVEHGLIDDISDSIHAAAREAADVVAGASGLLQANGTVSSEQFDRFTSSLLNATGGLPGDLKGIGIIQYQEGKPQATARIT